MKKKTRERIQLFFSITGFIAFCMVWGKMEDLDLDRITTGQAIVHGLIAILYIVIAYVCYHIVGDDKGVKDNV